MLVKRSKKKTNYCLPITIDNFRTYWYYDNEYLLFKAYEQLKVINNSSFIPSYPLILA